MSQCLLHVNNKHQKLIAENKQQLDEIFADIKKMKERANTPEGFSKRLKEYIKEIHEDKIKEEADQVLNLVKSDANYRRVMEMRKAGVPVGEAIRTFLTPSTHNAANAGVSVAPIMHKQTVKYTNMIEQNLTHGEMKVMAKGDLDAEIILDMAGGTKEGAPINATSKKMSEVFRKILDMTHADKNNAGIIVQKIKNYVFNQSILQDAEKMRNMDPDAWVDMQMKDLDHEKSFPYMQTDAEKREYLHKVYEEALKRDDEASVSNWEALKDKGILSSAVQAKYSKPRTLHYTPEGLVRQFQTFSDKPLVEVMMSEIAKSARDTANYEIFGPRGTVAMDTVVQKVMRDLRKQMHEANRAGDTKLAASLEKELQDIEASKPKYLQDIAQINNTNNKVRAKNKGNKAAFEAGRTLVNTAVLGNVPLSAVTDLAWNVTAQQISTDRGYLHGMGKLIKAMVENVPAGKRKAIVTKMRIAQESMLGHMLRVEGADTFLDRFSAKLNYLYSTVLPVQWQTRLHRTWAGNILGTDLAEMVGKNWKDLNELEVKGFEKAGIKEHDIEALRSMTDDLGPEYDGMKMVSPENITNVSDEVAMKAIEAHKAADKAFLPKTPAQYRAYLEKRLDAFIEDYMTTAVPMPGERAKGLLHGVGEAGEVGHETRKTLTMLKSFMVHQVALMQKVARASSNKGTKARHLSGMAMGLITMAYGRDVLEHLMQGEDIPDPTDPKVGLKAVVRSGVSGPLGDIVGGEQRGTFNQVTSFVGGPLVAKVNDAVGLGMDALKKGEVNKKHLKKAAKFVPGNNLMYWKLLNHHIIEDAAASLEE